MFLLAIHCPPFWQFNILFLVQFSMTSNEGGAGVVVRSAALAGSVLDGVELDDLRQAPKT